MVNRALTPPLRVSDSVRVLVDAFLDWARVERGFSSRSLETYRRGIARFVTEAGLTRVEDFSPACVTKVKRCLMDRGCSASYIAIVVMSMRGLLVYCRDIRGEAFADPAAIVPPRRVRRAVAFLTADEVARFVESIKLEKRWSGRTRRRLPYRQGILFRALVETLLGSGMRISEALSLQRDQIDWVQQETRIVGKGNKERVVFFTDRAIYWLRRYLALRTDPRRDLFVTDNGRARLDQQMARRWFRRQRRIAGLTKHVTPHVLRHTVATTLMFNGCPMGHIKEILGHERLDTTCRYYLGLDTRGAQTAHRKFLTYDCADAAQT